MTTPDRSGWRVLVIEDDGLIAMDISDTLDQLGHVVVGPMRTVESALATIDNQGVDLALLDVNLSNGETSYPIAEVLSKRGVPFAFLTGYGCRSGWKLSGSAGHFQADRREDTVGNIAES